MNEIFDISYDEIEVIKDLWEKNKQYHENISEYFKELYHSISFDQRMKAFGSLSRDTIKITVVKSNGEYVGYCLSTIIDGKGELETLHIDETYRGKGMGKKLVTKHIEWMKKKDCKMIGVKVTPENQSTITFYKKLGLYPENLYMQLR